MDNNEVLDKQYWEEVLSDLDRKDDNSARRYRRYNKSLEAMGEKTVVNESPNNKQLMENCNKNDECFGFFHNLNDERLIISIQQLKDTEQLILEQKVVNGYTFKEIAGILNTKESTVKMTYFRALEKIKKYF